MLVKGNTVKDFIPKLLAHHPKAHTEKATVQFARVNGGDRDQCFELTLGFPHAEITLSLNAVQFGNLIATQTQDLEVEVVGVIGSRRKPRTFKYPVEKLPKNVREETSKRYSDRDDVSKLPKTYAFIRGEMTRERVRKYVVHFNRTNEGFQGINVTEVLS